MPKPLHEKLREKGWSEEEIKKTVSMLQSPEKIEKHRPFQRQMSFGVFWMLLILLTIANFFVSIAIIPFLLILQISQLAVIVGIIGLGIGALFSLLIWDIEHLETKHHVGAVIFLPILALLSITLIVTASNALAENIIGGIHQNAVLIAVVYVGCFLVPYVFSAIRRHVWHS